jgi:hypothetical protein
MVSSSDWVASTASASTRISGRFAPDAASFTISRPCWWCATIICRYITSVSLCSPSALTSATAVTGVATSGAVPHAPRAIVAATRTAAYRSLTAATTGRA